jgi:hypothetical protein
VSRIPRRLHFCFGLAETGKPWRLIHHVCVRSALEQLRPEAAHIYVEHEPEGPWWELTRPLLDVVRVTAPREVFGRPISHFAHRADVLRLDRLIEDGGLYLDVDVLVRRSFDDLLDGSVVMGKEGPGGRYGVCNAVILAEPGAAFLQRWREEYRWFRGGEGGAGVDPHWNEHSVEVPSRLAARHPDEITVLSERAFFHPTWTQDDVRWIFYSTRPIPDRDAYAHHLWESKAWDYLEPLTPGDVRARPTNFHRWAAPYVAGLPDDYGALPGRKAVIPKGKPRLARLMRPGVRTFARRQAIRAADLLAGLSGDEARMRRRTFQGVYRDSLWGGDGVSRFFSGVGSRGEPADRYVSAIAEALAAHARTLGRAPTVVDLGCGDFEVGRALIERLPDMRYLGCDIVPELIEAHRRRHASERVGFCALDIVADPLPAGDVCLVRQVFQHLSNDEVARVLAKLDYPFVYVTEAQPKERVGPVNPDKEPGADVRFDWRASRGRGLELDQPPFDCTVEELVRAEVHELIVTWRVFTRPARAAAPPSQRSLAAG